MQIFYDLTTDRLVASPGTQNDLSQIELKRSPYQLFELQFGRSPSIVSTSILDSGSVNWSEAGFYTFTAATSDVLTLSDAREIENGYRVRVVTAGTLPAGLTADTNLYVIDLDKVAKTCKLSATQGGSAVDITDAGTGTHTLILWPEIWLGVKADGVYDGDFLAVAKTYSVDATNKLYRFYLSTQTTQIDALIGHENPGDGTTFTVDAGTDVVTLTDTDELADGDRVRLTTSGTLPAPLAIDTDYFWLAASNKLAATAGGSAIDITDTGTGTHTATRQADNTNDEDAISSAMFEVSFRNDVSENQWRPSINQVSATINHDVNDPATNLPTSTSVIPIANPMTTAGDIIIGGTGGAAGRLGIGTEGQVLTVSSGVPDWQDGLANPMTTAGDIIIGGTGGTTARLAAGTEGHALTIVSGVPAYAAPPDPVPNAIRTVTTSGNLLAADLGKILFLDETSGNVTLTIQDNGTIAYPDGFHFWVVRSQTAINSVSVARDTGVALIETGTDQDITPTEFVVYHIWRQAEDTWRVISKV